MSNASLEHYVKNCPKRQYYVLKHFENRQPKRKRHEDRKTAR